MVPWFCVLKSLDLGILVYARGWVLSEEVQLAAFGVLNLRLKNLNLRTKSAHNLPICSYFSHFPGSSLAFFERISKSHLSSYSA